MLFFRACGAIGVALLFLVWRSGCASDAPRMLAPHPPLGWNSFQSYGVYLNDTAAHANLDALAQLLAPHGYNYFVVDNGWFGEYKLQPGTLYPAEKHASDVHLNEHGFFLPSKTYFPNGFDALIRKCHERGLKFGVHLMRGIPRKAYELNLPIQGTAYTARDIADTQNVCTWCRYNYGVDMCKPGAQEWYDGLIRHLSEMGVDFIKYDDIVPYPEEVAAVTRAIAKCGRPMVLSLSPGDTVPCDSEALNAFLGAQMLRVTSDIWDDMHGINLCFKAWRKWGALASPNFWIDMDMIPFGQLQMMSPATPHFDMSAVRLAGKGTRRLSAFSRAQMETFITLRALSASPLMVGGDLPTLDSFSLYLLTHPEMLACNQNGVSATLVYERDAIEIWRVASRDDPVKGWLGVFNRSGHEKAFSLSVDMLGLPTDTATPPMVSLRGIWHAQNDTLHVTPIPLQIPDHGVRFFSYTLNESTSPPK